MGPLGGGPKPPPMGPLGGGPKPPPMGQLGGGPKPPPMGQLGGGPKPPPMGQLGGGQPSGDQRSDLMSQIRNKMALKKTNASGQGHMENLGEQLSQGKDGLKKTSSDKTNASGQGQGLMENLGEQLSQGKAGLKKATVNDKKEIKPNELQTELDQKMAKRQQQMKEGMKTVDELLNEQKQLKKEETSQSTQPTTTEIVHMDNKGTETIVQAIKPSLSEIIKAIDEIKNKDETPGDADPNQERPSVLRGIEADLNSKKKTIDEKLTESKMKKDEEKKNSEEHDYVSAIIQDAEGNPVITARPALTLGMLNKAMITRNKLTPKEIENVIKQGDEARKLRRAVEASPLTRLIVENTTFRRKEIEGESSWEADNDNSWEE
jgi:hypothetical protein